MYSESEFLIDTIVTCFSKCPVCSDQGIFVSRYLSWSGLTTKVFNVGEYRREATQDYRLLLNRI